MKCRWRRGPNSQKYCRRSLWMASQFIPSTLPVSNRFRENVLHEEKRERRQKVKLDSFLALRMPHWKLVEVAWILYDAISQPWLAFTEVPRSRQNRLLPGIVPSHFPWNLRAASASMNERARRRFWRIPGIPTQTTHIPLWLCLYSTLIASSFLGEEIVLSATKGWHHNLHCHMWAPCLTLTLIRVRVFK